MVDTKYCTSVAERRCVVWLWTKIGRYFFFIWSYQEANQTLIILYYLLLDWQPGDSWQISGPSLYSPHATYIRRWNMKDVESSLKSKCLTWIYKKNYFASLFTGRLSYTPASPWYSVYGVRPNTHPVELGLRYHSQPGQTSCPLSWDPGSNLNPLSRVVSIMPLIQICGFFKNFMINIIHSVRKMAKMYHCTNCILFLYIHKYSSKFKK